MSDSDWSNPVLPQKIPAAGNFNELAGLEIGNSESGVCAIRLRVEAMHLNVMGTVHGGVICTLLDTAMARACFHSRPTQQRKGATLEMKVNFLKSSCDGELTATGQLISSTRRTAYAEGRVVNESGQLIARASATMMLFESPNPE